MKNNIENSIKESLKNFEAPYNSAAWTAMNSKLDAKMPVSSSGGTLKWIVATSVVVVSLFATYYALNIKGSTQTDVKLAEQSSQPTDNTSKIEKTSEIAVLSEKNEAENDAVINRQESIKNDGTHNIESSVDNGDSESDEHSSIFNGPNNQNPPNGEGAEIDETTFVATLSLPKLKNVCANESVTIRNTNDIALELVGPGFNKLISANSTEIIELKNAGSYQLFGENSSAHIDFEVKRLPDVDFIIDTENKYEKGLPTTKLTSTVGNNLTWTVNNDVYKGKELDLHIYKRGAQNITLTEIGINGCSNSVRKQLFNEKKYNLMAVEGFKPNDIDPRNNTFMPFALTKRNVKFTLIIIDPTDGHIVYETQDSSQGWNGTDSKTGQVVKYGSAYIWKVILENPERGENNEYAGNIIPITL
tara:strand:+ start:866 stop:2116 length:1251 start_codon:yes stop_codon:yes gene_type:complete